MKNGLVSAMGVLLLLVAEGLGQEPSRAVSVIPQRAPAVASVVSGGGSDAYLLKIEEIEGPAPRLEQFPGAPAPEVGWVEASAGGPDQINVVKTTELLVSLNSRFHLKVTDQGDTVELSGRVKKSEIVPAKQFDHLVPPPPPPPSPPQIRQPPQIRSPNKTGTVASQPQGWPVPVPIPLQFIVREHEGQDLLVEVELRYMVEGHMHGMRSPVPIRFGKKWYMAAPNPMGGPRVFPQTLWSVERVKAESEKTDEADSACLVR